jgi:hypothetical protein
MLLGLALVTRFKTLEAALCCAKLVISFALMEKFCQLIIVPGVFVTVSVLPIVAKVACPFTTVPPTGLASALILKQQATANRIGFSRVLERLNSRQELSIRIERIRLDAERLPFALVISETAIQAPNASDQIVR